VTREDSPITGERAAQKILVNIEPALDGATGDIKRAGACEADRLAGLIMNYRGQGSSIRPEFQRKRLTVLRTPHRSYRLSGGFFADAAPASRNQNIPPRRPDHSHAISAVKLEGLCVPRRSDIPQPNAIAAGGQQSFIVRRKQSDRDVAIVRCELTDKAKAMR